MIYLRSLLENQKNIRHQVEKMDDFKTCPNNCPLCQILLDKIQKERLKKYEDVITLS